MIVCGKPGYCVLLLNNIMYMLVVVSLVTVHILVLRLYVHNSVIVY